MVHNLSRRQCSMSTCSYVFLLPVEHSHQHFIPSTRQSVAQRSCALVGSERPLRRQELLRDEQVIPTAAAVSVGRAAHEHGTKRNTERPTILMFSLGQLVSLHWVPQSVGVVVRQKEGINGILESLEFAAFNFVRKQSSRSFFFYVSFECYCHSLCGAF